MNKTQLEKLYLRYNTRAFVHPDPLEFLYNYPAKEDVEIAGLIASSLAYGRVNQILKSVSAVLNTLGRPYQYVKNTNLKQIKSDFRGFRHRFTSDQDIVDLISSISSTVRGYGSLNEAFLAGYENKDSNTNRALVEFVNLLGGPIHSLLPDPSKSSACKRLHLFLRWMIRHDEVDPGTWQNIPPQKLVIPLDTHMMAYAKRTNLTKRHQADRLASLEITDKFKEIAPEDPVKYDFVLTRFGIHPELSKVGGCHD